MKRIKFFFTAAWPEKMHKTALWCAIMVYTLLFGGVVFSWLMPGFSLWGRIWRTLIFIFCSLIYPWVSFYFLHIMLPAVEGGLVATYKIKDSWNKGDKHVTSAVDDFFIARSHYEYFGPLKRPVYDMEKMRVEKDEEYLKHLGMCLVQDMKQYKSLTDAMSSESIEDFAQKLIAVKYNRICQDTFNPISLENNDVGPYEIVVVVFNLFADADSIIGYKVLSQYVSKWFPDKFPVAGTVQTYFSRIRDRVKRRDNGDVEYTPQTKATKTEVPILSKEDLLDPESYYISRFRQPME